MGATKAFLKAIIAYYVAQITLLHLYMVFIRSPPTPTPAPVEVKVIETPEPPSPPLPPPEEELEDVIPPSPEPAPLPMKKVEPVIVTVIKNVDVQKTRDHLTQEQLYRLHKEINDSGVNESFSSSLREAQVNTERLANTIQNNLNQLETKNKNLPLMIKDEIQSLHEPKKAPLDLRMSSSSSLDVDVFEDFSMLLTGASYENVSEEKLTLTFMSMIDGLSRLKSYGVDFGSLRQIYLDGKTECDTFLTREITIPNNKYDGKFVTHDDLDKYQDRINEFAQALHKNPLKEIDDDFMEAMQIDAEEAFESAEAGMVDKIDYLKGYAEEINELIAENAVGDETIVDSCVEKSSVMQLWEKAREAMMTGDNVTSRLKDVAGTMDQSVKVEDLESSQSIAKHIKSDGKHPQRTLKQLIDTPLYPKLIEKIDEVVEFVAGYSDMVDQVIDYMGGKEGDGSVGKNLGENMNRLLQKIELPDDFEDFKKKIDLDGLKKRLGIE